MILFECFCFVLGSGDGVLLVGSYGHVKIIIYTCLVLYIGLVCVFVSKTCSNGLNRISELDSLEKLNLCAL